MTKSDTPRTDAAATWKHESGLYRIITSGTIDVAFARQLERELNEMKSCAEGFEKFLKWTDDHDYFAVFKKRSYYSQNKFDPTVREQVNRVIAKGDL